MAAVAGASPAAACDLGPAAESDVGCAAAAVDDDLPRAVAGCADAVLLLRAAGGSDDDAPVAHVSLGVGRHDESSGAEDPVEGRDGCFDVELSAEGEADVVLDGAAAGRGTRTIYGRVVRTLQRSLRRILDTCTHSSAGECGPCRVASPRTNQSAALRVADAPLLSSPIASVSEEKADAPVVHRTILLDVACRPLLPPQRPAHAGRKCLLLDLDETLVHSSFARVPAPDLVVPVHMGDGCDTQPIYVSVRPGAAAFVAAVAELFEVVVFTASLSNYADPVIDHLDPGRVISGRLYRESCLQLQGLFIKDMSRVGRPLGQTLLVDNSPTSYALQPENALGCLSWFSNPADRELSERILPLLVRLAAADDVPSWRAAHRAAIEAPYAVSGASAGGAGGARPQGVWPSAALRSLSPSFH